MSIRKDLEKRAKKAILDSVIENYKQQRSDWRQQPAIRRASVLASMFSTANALIIAAIILITGFLTILLFPFIGLGLGAVLGTVVGGGLLLLLIEVLFFFRAARDETAHAAAIADMLKPQVNFDPDQINDKVLVEKLNKALEYWAQIDDTINRVPSEALRMRFERTSREVTHWLQAVFNLATRLDKFEKNSIIERDLNSLPKSIKEYEARLKLENNPTVQQQLARTIADKKRQLQTLENLQGNMAKASYQLDSTISSLGTIYSQLFNGGDGRGLPKLLLTML